MTRAGDDAERSDVGVPPAAKRRGGVGARPHKWEVPPPACGGERRS